ncbi:MAG: hypothetical protein J0I73_04245 [Sphingomonas sp.]|uniref:hypothetical protein n=1 Tax=Sphingomonas sp. TaxID=28214 RepID=UPI001ACA291C|nr:hypothetical protein [Sphingomonas sp.]MBN8847295.1 hypothetical protein [Sphingomonas sp.]
MARQYGASTATTADDVAAAFDQLAHFGAGESVLVAGSLYLAGEVLAANDEPPD